MWAKVGWFLLCSCNKVVFNTTAAVCHKTFISGKKDSVQHIMIYIYVQCVVFNTIVVGLLLVLLFWLDFLKKNINGLLSILIILSRKDFRTAQ